MGPDVAFIIQENLMIGANSNFDEYLFVYGTLRKDQSLNSIYLKDFKPLRDYAIKTVDKYLMINIGRFPGVIEVPADTEGACQIVGDIYMIPKALMTALDRVEGHPTFYTRRQIRLEGFSQEAWMYFWPRYNKNHDEVIDNGDWVAFSNRERENYKKRLTAKVRAGGDDTAA